MGRLKKLVLVIPNNLLVILTKSKNTNIIKYFHSSITNIVQDLAEI